MGGTTSARSLVAGFLLVAIAVNAGFRIKGFDQELFAQNVGGWVHTYSRQIAAISISSSDKDVTVDDVHYASVDLLGLRDWEYDCIKEGSPLVRSNETNRSKMRQTTAVCNPPKDVVLDCCEGTFASATTVINFAFQKCQSSFSASEHENSSLPTLARRYLETNPIDLAKPGAMSCDVCQVVEHSRHHNLTITFVGDSVQAQVWQGLIYELQRRNYDLTLQSNQTQSPGFWKTMVQYREALTIRSELWPADQEVTMNFFQLYILPFEHAFEMEEVANSGDVLVIGWGLHWNSNDPRHPNSLPSAYITHLTDFLSFLRHNSTRPRRWNCRCHRRKLCTLQR